MPGPQVAPAKVGLLLDYPTGGAGPNNLIDALELTFDEAFEVGQIDRHVELVTRQVLGLPNGEFHVVRRAFDELVDEGCVVVFGPMISENLVALRDHIEQRGEVAVISMAGSETALGDWVFELNNGSMEEEPVIITSIVRHDGRQRAALLFEQSLIGREYLECFRSACELSDLEIAAEIGIPQVETEKVAAVAAARESGADCIVHVGFGHGLWGINDALRETDWDPPRYTTTAFELYAVGDIWVEQVKGWIGLDSYDERNETGQAFLDRFEKRYGRRPAYYMPIYGHDLGRVMAHGIANARPLTGKGVRDAIEHVSLLPAASGAPSTRLRFGRYIRQGWMGAEYLVARRMTDAGDHVFHGTINGTVSSGDAVTEGEG